MYEIYTIEHVISAMKQQENVASEREKHEEKHKANAFSKFIKKQKIFFRLFIRSLQTKRNYRPAM